ncbi:hypothetical protein [Bosea psychrotolerans]|uniref:hypothetical protein n=1 Tax=Bosea psychrotolerans TaxID=1871628 RepID=UPI000CDA0D9B|nr:hypothetical protein [Bosea psychrotolerans]
MEEYVALNNIKKFLSLLETETNFERRKTIEKLLAEEEAKLAQLARQSQNLTGASPSVSQISMLAEAPPAHPAALPGGLSRSSDT